MVGPMMETSYEACLDFNNSVSIFVSITQFSNFWVMSYGNWKHILAIFNFHNSVFNGISVNILTWWPPFTVSCLLSITLSFFFFFFFLFLFSSQATLFSPQATLFSPYPSTINTTHYSHSSSLPLQLKLKSSFCSVSVSAVGLVVPGCGLSSRRHRCGSRLGIYEFMFVCLREFVLVVFGLWERGKKNLKFGVGKRENMGYG